MPEPTAGPEGAPAPPPTVPPGPTAPATQPPVPDGTALQGKVQVSIALKLMTRALAAMGVESPEGQALAKGLSDLGKVFGESGDEMDRAEMKMLATSTSPVQSMGPGQQSAFGDMAKAQLGKLGLGPGSQGGAGPPGAPPGAPPGLPGAPPTAPPGPGGPPGLPPGMM